MALVYAGITKDPEFRLWHHEKIFDFKSCDGVFIGLQVVWNGSDSKNYRSLYRVYEFDSLATEEFQLQDEYYDFYFMAKRSFLEQVKMNIEDL